MRATVFGASGFIGRYVVRRLAAEGAVVVAAVRHPDAALFLKPMGNVGQITPVRAPVGDDQAVAAAVAGSDVVINLVGILYEHGTQRFDAVQRDGAERVARLAKAAGVGRLIQMSAIGADAASKSDYGRSKGQGEQAVRAAFPEATILRPSIVFGAEDDFFNRFAAMAKLLPALPLIGGGHTKFQPVYVDDVAEAVMRALADPATAGRTYELGGPGVYSFADLMRMMLAQIGRRRCLVPVPFGIARAQAWLLEKLPVPPLTRDQLRMLEQDNVAGAGPGLADLRIRPTALEAVLPTYLDRYRKGNIFPERNYR
ncbi:NADH dehydrogenase [Stella humosa]|uniref:NADH dehydrogenase n=1 Tax=Stella humosa TaxID=94 RepID=A0A3N1LN64_9PROT|nr:complex I NDUFA9 subunit family protein [Stella humosa]ROP90655.1 NADH dehydrogenase [Stella humosa]BBK29446.1 3-beta-hydroxy-Delta(5)-steroid dehydrogenase [Stella humosa]